MTPAASADLPPARRSQLRAVGTAFLRARPLVVAPALAIAFAFAAAAGTPARQLMALAVGATVMLAFFGFEAWRGRRRLVSERGLAASLLVTLAGIGAAAAVSGGLQSPFVPLLLAPAGVGFAAFGRGRPGLLVLLGLLIVMGSLAALPPGLLFPPLPLAAQRPLVIGSTITAGLLLALGVAGLTDAYARASATLERASEDVVAGAEAQVRGLEALGAQVAHEIKNPLAAVRGLCEVLGEKATDDKDRRRLEVMGGEIARIDQILHEYLSLSRPLGAVAREPTDLGALAAEVLRLLEARAERAGVALAARGPALAVSADPRRLKEALLNLLLNAIEHTPAGGEVAVSWGADAGGILLTVSDTGRGMSEDELARVGDAYFSTRTGGTGLGVRLARRVAEAHGGTLSFASAPGQGTRATLRLAGAA